jgi:hypothetical protein
MILLIHERVPIHSGHPLKSSRVVSREMGMIIFNIHQKPLRPLCIPCTSNWV